METKQKEREVGKARYVLTVDMIQFILALPLDKKIHSPIIDPCLAYFFFFFFFFFCSENGILVLGPRPTISFFLKGRRGKDGKYHLADVLQSSPNHFYSLECKCFFFLYHNERP